MIITKREEEITPFPERASMQKLRLSAELTVQGHVYWHMLPDSHGTKNSMKLACNATRKKYANSKKKLQNLLYFAGCILDFPRVFPSMWMHGTVPSYVAVPCHCVTLRATNSWSPCHRQTLPLWCLTSSSFLHVHRCAVTMQGMHSQFVTFITWTIHENVRSGWLVFDYWSAFSSRGVQG